MHSWDLTTLDVEPGRPQVLRTVPQGRAIAITLLADTALKDHEVHEGAWLIVAAGRVRVTAETDEAYQVGPGGFVAFDPGERRDISAVEDARLLLLLTPWPSPDRRASGTA